MNTFVFADWERPKPNSATMPAATAKSSSASSPRDAGTPRSQNNREMSSVSVLVIQIAKELVILVMIDINNGI